MRCVADELGEASGEVGVERMNGSVGDSLNPFQTLCAEMSKRPLSETPFS